MVKRRGMMKQNNGQGIGIIGVVQIVFITLKLLGVVSWTWTTVFIPTFIYLGIVAILFMILGFVAYANTRR